jgi:hypothetical protein
MSTPLDNHRAPELLDARLLDRLVDGELPEVERRELLLRLEAEPGGWRRCALAFLEAQCWRDVLTRPAVAAGPMAQATPLGKRRSFWRPVLLRTAVAASLVVAFALGWAVRNPPAPTVIESPVASSEPRSPAEPVRPAPGEVADEAPRPSPAAEADDPVIKQFEQRGFRAERQRRVVSVQLKDGRRIDVPVQEVRLQHVRGRTY